MPESSPKWGYDYRFGTVFILVDGQQFQIKVSDIMSHIPIYALREYFQDALRPEHPIEDIEIIRQKTVTDTALAGKTVLDVGGYMGEFARLALDNGAARAIVLDNEQWRHYGWKEERLEGVEYVKGSLTDYHDCGTHLGNPHNDDLQGLPKPDVIILYNILYHLKNPWQYLDRCRELIADNGTMLVCTLFRYHEGRWCYWYEPRECNSTDETVYNGPSLETLELWFRQTGWNYVRTGLSLDRVCYRLTPIEGWVRQHEDD